MESIVQLLISMVVAYEKYGDSIGYTKEELDKFIQKYDLFKLNWNELGSLVLLEHKYISKEKFAEVMELKVDEDGEFWMEFNDFEDALPSDFDFEASVLDGRLWENWIHSEYYDYDFSLNDFTEDTLNAIIDYCDRNGCEIETDNGEILLTKDNMKVEKGSIYVGDENLDEHMKDDGMEELVREIQCGISDAHEDAELDDIYTSVKNNFEKGFGSYKFVSIKNSKGKGVDMLWVKVEADLSEVMVALEDSYTYNGETTYSTAQHDFGNMYHVLHEFNFIEMKKPYYDNSYSSPSRQLTNECVRIRLKN